MMAEKNLSVSEPGDSSSSSRYAGVRSGFVGIDNVPPADVLRFTGNLRHWYVKNFNRGLALTVPESIKVTANNGKVLQVGVRRVLRGLKSFNQLQSVTRSVEKLEKTSGGRRRGCRDEDESMRAVVDGDEFLGCRVKKDTRLARRSARGGGGFSAG
jgi:hypothetical protein